MPIINHFYSYFFQLKNWILYLKKSYCESLIQNFVMWISNIESIHLIAIVMIALILFENNYHNYIWTIILNIIVLQLSYICAQQTSLVYVLVCINLLLCSRSNYTSPNIDTDADDFLLPLKTSIASSSKIFSSYMFTFTHSHPLIQVHSFYVQ